MVDKKKCKYLCTDCEYYYQQYHIYGENDHSDSEICQAYKKKAEISCVNGTVTMKQALCNDYNKDGCCKKYKPKAHLRLIKILQQYLGTIPMDWAGRDSVEMVLIRDLLTVLDKGKSEYFEDIDTDDTPYGAKIVVTKEAMQKSLHYREYKFDYEKDGNLYTQCEKLTEEEISKRKAWLSMIKTLLGLKE